MSRDALVWRLDGVLPDSCPDPSRLHRHLLTRNLRLHRHLLTRNLRLRGHLLTRNLRLRGHLLTRNLRLRGVHYALDDVGDPFLSGSLPLPAVTADDLDRLLGEVLQLLERDQEVLLRLAYGPRPAGDGASSAKLGDDGAGRRPAGTPDWAPRRDPRR